MHPTPALDRGLAAVGLSLNVIGLLVLPFWLALEAPLATARLVVGLAAVLPALVLGVVASAALLARRRWGRIVAIVALAIALATALGYGIVWLVLVPQLRPISAVALPLLWLLQLLLLIYWSLPRKR